MKKLIIIFLCVVFSTGLVAQRGLPPKHVPPFKSVNSVNLIEKKPTLEPEPEGLLAQVLVLLKETTYPLPVNILNLLVDPSNQHEPELACPQFSNQSHLTRHQNAVHKKKHKKKKFQSPQCKK